MDRTKGKWSINYNGNDEPEYIYSEDTTQWICQMNRPMPTVLTEREKARRKANAEFICKAVNSHDALVEACNLALHNEGKQWSEIKQVLQAALDAEYCGALPKYCR